MFSHYTNRPIVRRSFILLLSGLLAACGGGDGSTVSNIPSGITLSGSVGDGPITGATVTIADASGSIIATTTSDETANYKVMIPATAAYPLIITATDGLDMVSGTAPDFTMISLASDPADKTANINPFSTLIVKTAQFMTGGPNKINLDLAAQIILKHLNFGLDTTLVSSPITTSITEQNVATIVKSSEVFAEMLRRARKTLIVTENTINEDQLMQALAADLTDGFLDGNGTEMANPLTAAAINVASGQVLVEALSNNLDVNEAPATLLMDNAIRLTIQDATDTTADTVANEEMLGQAKIALNAAQLLDSDPALATIAAALTSVAPGDSPDMLDILLPASSSLNFSNALTRITLSTATELEEVNTSTKELIGKTTPPIISLTIDSSSIDESGLVTLIWASSNTQSCNTSGPVTWNSSGAISGEEMVGPLSADTNFTLTCTNNSSQITSKTVTAKVSSSLNPVNTGTGGSVGGTGNNNPSGGDASTGIPDDSSNAGGISGPSNSGPGANGGGGTNSQMISLNWNPSPGNIVGYIVNYGSTESAAVVELMDIPVTITSFNSQAPSVDLDTQVDLGMFPGDNVCFKVRAYNNTELSDWSPAVCGTI